MSLIKTYKATVPPNWLASETGWTKKTYAMLQSMGTKDSVTGRLIVKSGTVYPTDDANAVGIVTDDIDVTTGDVPGSVTIAGRVYEDRFPSVISEAAKTALTNQGLYFDRAPDFIRP